MDPTSSTAPTLASLSFNNTLGALLIGVIISFIFLGFNFSQAVSYFENFEEDPLSQKIYVGVVVVVESVQAVFIIHIVYTLTVTDFGQPIRILFTIWSLPATIPLTSLSALLTQFFFALRLWRFSNRSLFFASIIGVLSILQFVFSISVAIKVAKPGSIFLLEVDHFKWMITVAFSSCCACDVFITLGLCFYIHPHTQDARSSKILRRVVLWTVNNFMLPTTLAIVDLILLLVMPKNFIYIGAFTIIGKLYPVCALASLNDRVKLRKALQEEYKVPELVIGSSTTRNDTDA